MEIRVELGGVGQHALRVSEDVGNGIEHRRRHQAIPTIITSAMLA